MLNSGLPTLAPPTKKAPPLGSAFLNNNFVGTSGLLAVAKAGYYFTRSKVAVRPKRLMPI